MNDRWDERGAPPHQALHWPQPVALAPDETLLLRPREGAGNERDSYLTPIPPSSPSGSVLGLLVATTLAALVMMSITIAALYLGGVFAPGVP